MRNIGASGSAGIILSIALLVGCQAAGPQHVRSSPGYENAVDPAGCEASGHSNYRACRSREDAARGKLNTDQGRCYTSSRSAPAAQADIQTDAELRTPGMAVIMAQQRAYDQCLIAAGHQDEIDKRERASEAARQSPSLMAEVAARRSHAYEAAQAMQSGGRAWSVNDRLCYSRTMPSGVWAVNCQ
jgi:hypothetical protein